MPYNKSRARIIFTLFITLTALILAPVSGLSAAHWYIMPDSTGDAPNIQAGIDSCAAGDTVLVAAGIFRGDGNRDIDFRGKHIVVIAESSVYPAVTDSTVIDCQSTNEEPHGGFHFHSGETRESVIAGFIIENGGGLPGPWPYSPADIEKRAETRKDIFRRFFEAHRRRHPMESEKLSSISSHLDSLYRIHDLALIRSLSTPRYLGGAIRCDSASSPTIMNNTIRSCSSFLGGGIACFDSMTSPRILGNKIVDCTGFEGGGIICIDSSPEILNNKIISNIGTGIVCNNARIVISNNDIVSNWSTDSGVGGGIIIRECLDADILDNNIEHNLSYALGGIGIYGSNAFISGNTISGNGAEGGGCMVVYGSSVQVIDNEMYNNSSHFSVTGFCDSNIRMEGNYFHENGSPNYSSIEMGGSNKAEILNNTFAEEHAAECIFIYGDSTCVIRGNTFERMARYSIYTFSSITIENNRIRKGAIFCQECSPKISGNLVTDCYEFGIKCWMASPSIFSNTIAFNTGYGIHINEGSSPNIESNIIAFNSGNEWYFEGGGIYTENPEIDIACNDVFDNAGGDYVGIPDQTGIGGNFSANPLFCDLESNVYTLHVLSPCMPGNHPYGCNCGLIGAFGAGCNYIASLLQSYSASFYKDAIKIRWEVSEPMSADDFVIYRSEDTSLEFQDMPEAEITVTATSFKCIDREVLPGKRYYYRVELFSEGERTILFESDVVSVPALPLTLRQNYPNPFNPSTRIDYYLPERSIVSLDIFDISGRQVARLIDETEEAGNHSVIWDGSNDSEIPASSGTYFYRLTAGKESISRKMILLR